MKKKIVVFTGAGISAESGIPTFRDGENSLWNKFNVEEVATMTGWKKDREKVNDFHNKVMAECLKCEPNDAHKELVRLEEKYDVSILTQNIDVLHEKAGSTNVIHIHGNISQSKSSLNTEKVYPLNGEIKIGDKADDGSQLRHNTVLFGENLPKKEFEKATKAMEEADILIIIGTSLVVYPAAGLIENFNDIRLVCSTENKNTYEKNPIYVIDPNPVQLAPSTGRIFIMEKATMGTKYLVDKLMS